MLIGYARTSTEEQNMSLQEDALKQIGCDHIFTDSVSGMVTERPGLNQVMSHLRAGDTLVVWKLDRLGRSMKHLIELIEELALKDIQFKSLQDNIDTSTASGKLIFHIFCSIAEFERDLIVQRTLAGLAAARSRGRFGGRQPKLDSRQIAKLKKIYDEKRTPIPDMCKIFGISKQSIYNYLKI